MTAKRRATGAPTEKRWTVMVYLAGDNNLSTAGEGDLREMKQVGSTNAVNVVVQFDRAGRTRKTQRYYVRKGTSLAKDVVQSLGETDYGDPRVLTAFIDWAIARYPAQHYMLVLWNHGAGCDNSNLYAGDYFSAVTPPVVRKRTQVVRCSPRTRAKPIQSSTVRAGARRAARALFASTAHAMMTTRAICFDDQAKDFLDNVELKRVLEATRTKLRRKLDVLGFDACLMSMVEVAYQLKGGVAVSCGSEEEEPNEGWPYARILGRLAARPSMSPKALASTVAREYLASYRQGDGVTFAATDVAALDALARSIDGLASVLGAAIADPAARAAVLTARSQVQEYSSPYDEYVDLVDLCDVLTRNLARDDVTTACAAVRTAAASAVIASGAKGARVAHSHGLSIYFPKKRVCQLYATLD